MEGPATPTRHTPQKDEVREALRTTSGFVSAQHLHRRMVLEGSGIGLATVYRHLRALAASGDADVLSVASERLYRACGPGVHHHLVCEDCGTAVEIAPPPEDQLRAVARAHGYTIADEAIELFGLCADCTADDGPVDQRRRAGVPPRRR